MGGIYCELPKVSARRARGQKVARPVIGERYSATKERARILNGLKSKGIAKEGCSLATLPMISRQRPGGPITSEASDRRHRNPGYAFQS